MQINKEHECEIIKKPMRKNQKDWIKYFNNKGEKTISAPNIYKVEGKELIGSLIKDFEEDIVITGSRMIYNKNNLYADIIHDVDSKYATPKKYKVKVPVFNGDFEENKETEEYLQAQFGTKDSLDKILKTLKKKFGKDKKLQLWTPSQSNRKSRPIRSVGLYFDDLDWFVVIGSDWFDDLNGLSRGVIVDSAKQTKKSGGKSK